MTRTLTNREMFLLAQECAIDLGTAAGTYFGRMFLANGEYFAQAHDVRTAILSAIDGTDHEQAFRLGYNAAFAAAMNAKEKVTA